MTSLLIKNIDILTLDSAGTILRNSNIGVEGKTIKFVGAAPPDFVADETIEGYNQVAVPGFFNAHCHAAMTFERGWAEDLPLDRWFNERIWVAESALTSDDVYWGRGPGGLRNDSLGHGGLQRSLLLHGSRG